MSEPTANQLLGMQKMLEFFGEEHVNELRSRSRDDLPSKIGGEYLAEVCFSSYARPALTFRDRSLMNIAMLIALNCGPELRIHLRAALHNGLSDEQLCEACRHAMVYCGVPAGRDALAIAGEVLEERKQSGRNIKGAKLA